MTSGSGLDVLVRFHSLARFSELERCLFSLVAQSYADTTVQLLLQRFSPDGVEELERRLSPILSLNPQRRVSFINFTDDSPIDARSKLLNLGIEASKGRFIAILDYDDTINKDAYTKLVARLKSTDAAIAFGRIAVKYHEVFGDALIVTAKEHKFQGMGLIDLFEDNFCPIHSFVLDRSKVESADLFFSEMLSRLEDYDFLLRIVSKYPSDFNLVREVVGDYYFKSDGSNTVQVSADDGAKDLNDWERARAYVSIMKSKSKISERVQRRMGISEPMANLTIGSLLRLKGRVEAARTK